MSRHIPRHDRWTAHGPTEHRADGLRVFFERGAWWADVTYRLRTADAQEETLPAWEPHTDRLGPFKRPRNAMVEAERHATALRNRHRERLRLVTPDA